MQTGALSAEAPARRRSARVVGAVADVEEVVAVDELGAAAERPARRAVLHVAAGDERVVVPVAPEAEGLAERGGRADVGGRSGGERGRVRRHRRGDDVGVVVGQRGGRGGAGAERERAGGAGEGEGGADAATGMVDHERHLGGNLHGSERNARGRGRPACRRPSAPADARPGPRSHLPMGTSGIRRVVSPLFGQVAHILSRTAQNSTPEGVRRSSRRPARPNHRLWAASGARLRLPADGTTTSPPR